MIVRHFDVKTLETQPPQDEGWEQGWHGYYLMTKIWSEEFRARRLEGVRAAHTCGELDESSFEQDCFLSVLADITRQHVNMFELGAGWGEWCLALAGVIDHNIIPVAPTSYHCLAVEGEPTHYRWTKEHFEVQNIKGTVVHGAVSNKNGVCRFNTYAGPDSCYGEAINSFTNIRKLANARNLLVRLMNRTTKVQMYTVDDLIETYNFDHVDIIHMDVQRAEYEVALGAVNSIKNDLIDYMIIGTHHRKLNDMLRQLLSPKFDLIIDLYPNSVGKVNGFAPIRCGDGIQLYKRTNM